MTITYEDPQTNTNEEDFYSMDTAMTSIVSYPSRCNLWGNPRFRGNCDGTLFKNLVLRYKAKRVCDPMMGSGTTKDVIDGLNNAGNHRIEYWGSDLTAGFNLLTDPLPGSFDFIWIHPPYWNIVRYSKNDPRDLSTYENYHDFREALARCLTNCYAALMPGGRLALLVGDVRRRGVYTPIMRDVLSLEGRLGQLRSIIIKAQHNCSSDAKQYARMEDVPIKHEYCLVFKKPPQ